MSNACCSPFLVLCFVFFFLSASSCSLSLFLAGSLKKEERGNGGNEIDNDTAWILQPPSPVVKKEGGGEGAIKQEEQELSLLEMVKGMVAEQVGR